MQFVGQFVDGEGTPVPGMGVVLRGAGLGANGTRLRTSESGWLELGDAVGWRGGRLNIERTGWMLDGWRCELMPQDFEQGAARVVMEDLSAYSIRLRDPEDGTFGTLGVLELEQRTDRWGAWPRWSRPEFFFFDTVVRVSSSRLGGERREFREAMTRVPLPAVGTLAEPAELWVKPLRKQAQIILCPVGAGAIASIEEVAPLDSSARGCFVEGDELADGRWLVSLEKGLNSGLRLLCLTESNVPCSAEVRLDGPVERGERVDIGVVHARRWALLAGGKVVDGAGLAVAKCELGIPSETDPTWPPGNSPRLLGD